jgi:SAM-dependent methyltransferase
MDWQAAGRAWSERATDWAYLMESFTRPVNEVVLDRLAVSPGVQLLDIACGSGYALTLAAERGAVVSGLDASDGLIAVASARLPEADFRVGDMDALPFGDGTFDVATSFGGIISGCEQAAAEAFRVLRPGGLFGLTSWGSPRRREHLAYFMALVDISPAEHIEHSMVGMAFGRPGQAEALLGDAGFEVLERGDVDAVSEWPSPEIAVRAVAAVGASWPAIEHVGYERFHEVMLDAMDAVHDERTGIRLRSEWFWIIARRPE